MSRALLLNLAVAAIASMLEACVTVTVNFPAADPEETAAPVATAQPTKSPDRLRSASEKNERQSCTLARQPLCPQGQIVL